MLSIALFCVCMFAGMVNSVAGGGIMIVFPALMAVGLPPLTANTTSNLISWPSALSSAFGYRAYLRKLPAKYLLLLVPCIAGAFTGAALLARTDRHEFARIVPYLVLLAVLLFIFQPLLHRHFVRNLRAHHNAPLIVVGLALLPMSIYGGYFGAGFGFLMLAFLGFTRISSIHQINGLKNIASGTVTLVCTIYFTHAGLIDWDYAPAMISGSLLGGYLGAHGAQRVNPAWVHSFVVALGLCVSLILFVRS